MSGAGKQPHDPCERCGLCQRAGQGRTEVVVMPTNNRVVRYKKDAVGNDLTTVLRWCETHSEPVWQYDDESFTCPQERIIEFNDGSHALIDGPWEHA